MGHMLLRRQLAGVFKAAIGALGRLEWPAPSPARYSYASESGPADGIGSIGH